MSKAKRVTQGRAALMGEQTGDRATKQTGDRADEQVTEQTSEQVAKQVVRAQVDPGEYLAQMQAELEKAMGEVIQAVNEAPDGAWIDGSEDAAWEAITRLRAKAYETAIQMRANAAEAELFPPQR